MNKVEFTSTLKRALDGLPAETAAKTLAYYEQCFVNGAMAGRSEEEIAEELGDPRKIALTLRANSHLKTFEKRPVNALRVLVSALGLGIFNLFMLVPAVVYTALVACVYAAALAFYVSGIAITATGLAGANEVILDGPLSGLIAELGEEVDFSAPSNRTRIHIGEHGIHITDEPREEHEAGDIVAAAAQAGAAAREAGKTAAQQAAMAARAAAVAATEAAAEAATDVASVEREVHQRARKAVEQAAEAEVAAQMASEAATSAATSAATAQAEAQARADGRRDAIDEAWSRRRDTAIGRGELLARKGLHITADLDETSRTRQVLVGLGLVLGGIALFLVALVVTKYSWTAIKRYIQMNISLLKGG
jgi:uncharacterized membrane protein